jgi:hypothetical protein
LETIIPCLVKFKVWRGFRRVDCSEYFWFSGYSILTNYMWIRSHFLRNCNWIGMVHFSLIKQPQLKWGDYIFGYVVFLSKFSKFLLEKWIFSLVWVLCFIVWFGTVSWVLCSSFMGILGIVFVGLLAWQVLFFLSSLVLYIWININRF